MLDDRHPDVLVKQDGMLDPEKTKAVMRAHTKCVRQAVSGAVSR